MSFETSANRNEMQANTSLSSSSSHRELTSFGKQLAPLLYVTNLIYFLHMFGVRFKIEPDASCTIVFRYTVVVSRTIHSHAFRIDHAGNAH